MAEEEVADPDADPGEDEDGDDERERIADAKKAKKAKAVRAEKKDDEEDEEEGDDGSDRKDEKDTKASAARARERGRIAAIMKSDAAAAHPAAALELALGTTASRRSAIATLRAMSAAAPAPAPAPSERRDQARQRLARVDVPEVGADGAAAAPTGDAAVAARIVAADKKRRGIA